MRLHRAIILGHAEGICGARPHLGVTVLGTALLPDRKCCRIAPMEALV